ncbi:MAG: CDP-glycerol glycerophosphotransferase family protein [Ruminococcus sp.]|nr:CDP-glycerol glycerophosphotransferase family protein [Ruminococcus sp.]MBQ7134612.1 CDP-glycerol glycerophosphotransferase family protein [Ruminococcus sp.]
MQNQTKCTFVILIDTYDGLINLSTNFKTGILNKSSVQTVIVNRADMTDIESENAKSYANKKGYDYLQMPSDTTIPQCYNNAISLIKGQYVCFTNQYCIYDDLSVIAINKSIKNHPDANLVSLNYKKKNPDLDIHIKRYNFSMRYVDINKIQNVYSFLPAVFVKADFIGDIKFEDVCEEESATLFLMNLYKKDSMVVLFEKTYCRYDSAYISLASTSYYGCNNKDFYINSLKDIYLKFINSYTDNGLDLPVWLVKLAYYRLYFKFYSNFNVRNKFLLNDVEIKEFFDLSKQLLQFVPDKLILNNAKSEQFVPPFDLRVLFTHLKYDGDKEKLKYSFSHDENKMYFNRLGCTYDLSSHKNLTVRAFNFRKGNFSIDLRFFTRLLYDYDNNVISVKVNGEDFPCNRNDIYYLDKVFGVSIASSYTFSVDIPLNVFLNEGTKIEFFVTLNGKTQPMELEFYRPPSKLNTNCPHSYFMVSKDLALVYEDKMLKVISLTPAQRKKREKQYVKEALKAVYNVTLGIKTKLENCLNMLKLRKAYFRRKDEFKDRRIWLFFDKLYKAGDNGEYAFRYAMKQNDNIECYYIINADSLDYPRLKEEFPDNLLIYNSFECQLYSLMAENIIATHPDIIEFCSINPKLATVVKDLYNPNLVCIAHGITIQKNADYQNRLYDNTMFYTTSSKYEVEHILRPVYGYREDEVALTGLARFDGLKNNDQKQILITPTWRRNLVGGAQRNSTRQYSDAFKKTSYYKIYNSLINDPRIIEVAKKTGYKIIFLLHPAMSAQIDDYDKNEYVKLIQASGDLNYEKILTESSLMVTDYSGIHYDFGYMRKPIVYYQPKEVPMRFEEGGMKFATMGFGPVCDEYEEAVKLICEYMSNECKMPDEYKKRADDFFAFDDFNSCERIYDAVLKWTNERKEYEVK